MIIEFWTGHGVSFAIAHAFACARRRLGKSAFALPPAELPPSAETLYVVSRSGRTTLAPSRLVTLAGNEPEGIRTLAVADPAPVPEPWLPLSWVRAALDAFAVEHGGASLPETPPSLVRVCFAGETSLVLVVDRDADPLIALIAAVVAKVGPVPIVATSRTELGHGLHARIAGAPARYRIVALGETSAPDPALARWAEAAGVHLQGHGLPAAPPWATPLVQLRLLTDLVASVCARRAIDTWRRPIPEELDTLR